MANLGIEQKRQQVQGEIEALQRLDQQLLQFKQEINRLFAPH
ncbi:hypothetical protein [Pseudomonas lalucatii]|nr:hypothetical protein [Pseudomonas lalucatii]